MSKTKLPIFDPNLLIWQPKDGKNVIRILPDLTNDTWSTEYESPGGKRFLAYILDRDADPQVPRLFTMPPSVDRNLAELCLHRVGTKEPVIRLIDDPDHGFDVILERTKIGDGQVHYSISLAKEPSPIFEDSQKMDFLFHFLMLFPISTFLKKASA